MIEKLKKRDGYYTVEAAIVLPLIVLSIFALLMIVKIYYIQTIVQSAIDQSAVELSQYSYLYKKSLILDQVTDVKEDWERADGEMREKYKDLKSDVNNVVTAINDAKNMDISFMDEFKSEEANDDLNTFQKVNLYIEKSKIVQEGLTDSVKKIYLVLEKSEALIDTFKSLDVSGSTVKKMIGIKLLKQAQTCFGNLIIISGMKKNISEELMSSYVVGGYDGLDMSLSSYFDTYTHSEDLESSHIIDIIAIYQVDVPIPIPFMNDIQLVNRVTLDTWTGGTNDD